MNSEEAKNEYLGLFKNVVHCLDNILTKRFWLFKAFSELFGNFGKSLWFRECKEKIRYFFYGKELKEIPTTTTEKSMMV